MTTLREPDISRCPQCGGIADNGHDRSIPPSPYFCRKCMEQPVPEQMAQKRGEANCHPPWRCACGANLYLDEYGYPASRAAPAQEPVAWLTPRNVDSYSRPDLGYETSSRMDYGAFPVYTAPPQRRLTDDEIGRLWFQAKIPGLTETSARLLIRAAEEALRSKGAPA